ncbi:MAG TPA: molybdopterin oxidoreductase [Tissierellales bacterium]|nr:molybdopterin oxidoreductase [Tissierellales bacterium]
MYAIISIEVLILIFFNVKCNICPVGCMLEVGGSETDINVTGNRCGRGIEYARKLISDESKILTGRCILLNGPMGRLPVVSSKPVPKDISDAVLEQVRNLRVYAPVEKGQILIENIMGSGIDILAQRRVGRSSM